jgi:hypothetical protein
MDESRSTLVPTENNFHALRIDADPVAFPVPMRITTPDAVLAALLGGERYVVLTGPARSGKTRLLDELVPRLDAHKMRTVRVENPDSGPFSLKRLLSGVLAVPVGPEDLPEETAASACERIMFPEGGEGATVVVVDDAHTLQGDALCMLDLVSNPAGADGHRVQVLLVGRPALQEVLRIGGPVGLLDRISRELVLPPPEIAQRPAIGLPALQDTARAVPHRGHTWRMVQLVVALALASAGAVGIGRWAWQSGEMTWLSAFAPVPAGQNGEAAPLQAAAQPATLTQDAKIGGAASPQAAAQPTAPMQDAQARAQASQGGDAAIQATASTRVEQEGEAPSPEAAATAAAASPLAPLATPDPARTPVSSLRARPLPAATLQDMLARANALLAIGDVSAARLLYERAAAAGDATAAAYAGRTHDPRFLAGIGVVGLRPDAEAASRWYRRAIELGHHDAERWLESLERSAR